MDDASLWVGPAVRAAVSAARAQGCDAVLATGPPFSVTIAGARVAAELGVPLVVDLRDAWRGNPSAWFPNASARARSEAAEAVTLAAADAVTATTPSIVAEALDMGAKGAFFVPNGFDPSDLSPWSPDPSGPLRLAFMGKMYGMTEPWVLMDALKRLHETRPDVRIELDVVGDAPAEMQETIRSMGVEARFAGYLAHAEAVRRVALADVGLVLIADIEGGDSYVPGKVYEYLGIGMPILAIVPEFGEAARLVREAGAGWVVAPTDAYAMVTLLGRLAEQKRDGAMVRTGPDQAVIDRFDRREQSRCLAQLLDEVRHRG